MDDSYYIENDFYIVIAKENFEIAIAAGRSLSFDSSDDNIDVELRFKSGEKLTATFFTIENIKSLFEKNKRTGECGSGLYFNCPDMILVEKLTVENIVKTVEDLFEQGELEQAFKNQN